MGPKEEGPMKSRAVVGLAAISLVLAACAQGTAPTPGDGDGSPAPDGDGAAVELTIESWRNDDLAVWEDTIIPAFEAANAGISLRFAPTAPTEYNAALNSK